MSAGMVLVLGLILAPLNAGGGCRSEAAMDEFRTVAADGLSAGLQTILSAVVDGVFAVVEPNPDGNSDGDAAN
jgi:hypothetical protein